MSNPAWPGQRGAALRTLPAVAPAHGVCSAPLRLTTSLRSADSGSACALASGVFGAAPSLAPWRCCRALLSVDTPRSLCPVHAHRHVGFSDGARTVMSPGPPAWPVRDAAVPSWSPALLTFVMQDFLSTMGVGSGGVCQAERQCPAGGGVGGGRCSSHLPFGSR